MDSSEKNDASRHVEDTTSDLKPAPTAAGDYQPGSEAEKKLLRKLDTRIIPCCWFLYILGYLDRGNIGNAKTAGLETDFALTSTQYSIILLVFFVSYVIFEIPSNLLLTRVRPSYYLPGLAIVWGGVAACMGATKNWEQLAAIRFLLGICEAGFAPGIAFYLSCWYRRYEVASRFGYYYTAVSASGMVSGLLAGVITQNLDGVRGLSGWRWLFIIEGVLSSFVGMVVWFFMADFPSNTKWLTPEERILAEQRIAYDGIGSTQGTEDRIAPWSATLMAVRDWKTWILALLFSLITGAQTMQYYLPTLVAQFGWVSWEGQYHTIPPYALGLVLTLLYTFLSDHYQNKPFFISLFSGIHTIFFIVVSAVTNNTIRYVFTIFAFSGIFGIAPLILNWVSNVVDTPAEKRAVAIALVNALGNMASIYGVFLWPKSDAPRFIPGFSATTAWMGLICVVSPIAGWFFTSEKEREVAREAEEMRRGEVV